MSIFFIAIALAFVVLLGSSSADKDHSWPGFLYGLCMLAAIASIFAVLRIWKKSPLGAHHALSIEELEQQGLVTSSDHEARRALAIEEYEDEGSCYLVELADGSILCLRGQYLYEYEEGKGGSDKNALRRFPNTRFQLKRNRETGDILGIVCLGEAFEPEFTASAVLAREYENSEVLLDGEIVSNVTFDELLASEGRLPASAG